MVNTLELVREFHNKFRIEEVDCSEITEPMLRTLYLRKALILEETEEVSNAVESLVDSNDLETRRNLLKELCDLQYVLDGTFLSLGFGDCKSEAMLEVHRSNMSKLDKDGNPIFREDGKILKSDQYSPADFSHLL